MKTEDFAAWLKGFVEAVGTFPTPEQWQKIVDKLALVDLTNGKQVGSDAGLMYRC